MKCAPTKKTIKETLEFLDLFGLESRFLIYGNSKFKTTFGGLLTIIYVGFVLLIFFSLSSNMIKRQNPDSSISELYNGNPSSSKVGPDDYFFIFGLQNPNTYQHFYDPSIYNVTIGYGHLMKPVPFERCTEGHLPQQGELNYFFKTSHHSNLSELLCIKKDVITSFEISGDFAVENYNYFKIKITPCQNSTNGSPDTSNNICKPIEVIEENIGRGYFAFYSADTLIDVMDYENPGKRVGLNYFIDTGLTLGKRISRYLATVSLNSDNGWLTDDVAHSKYTSFSKDRESFHLIKENERFNSTFLEMDIRKSVYERTYNRKYLKVQAVMAFMGGFLQIMFISLYFFTRPFVIKLFNDKIINSTFNFEEEKAGRSENESRSLTLTEKTDRKSRPNSPSLPPNRNKILEMVGSFNGADPLNDNKESKSPTKINSVNPKLQKVLAKELHKLNSKPLNLSTWQLLSGYFSTGNPHEVKKNQRLKGITNILEKLDIVTLLQKFTEIDKLKMVLLNEDQYNLFHILPKPFIQKDSTINYSYETENFSESKKKKSIFLEYDSQYTKTKIAQASFKKIIHKQTLSVVDRKLISLISPEIKNIMMNEKFSGLFETLNSGEKDLLKKITQKTINKSQIPKNIEDEPMIKEDFSFEEPIKESCSIAVSNKRSIDNDGFYDY